jgi:hypothetical protein
VVTRGEGADNGPPPPATHPVTGRPTSWWLDVLRRRARHQRDESLDLHVPPHFGCEEERLAALKFFNAAYRAEESGLRQAHELADEVAAWDPNLAEVLRLYGNEEGWHRELLTEFLGYLGGSVAPMGRVTRLLYALYARAERMETIVLTNLMFETIGSTTYRLALGRVEGETIRQMLRILTRDEAFHVPLNAHFLRTVLGREPPEATRRLRLIFHLTFVALVSLPLASRPKSGAFDRIGTLELSRAYARELSRLFDADPSLPFTSPRWLMHLLRVAPVEGDGLASTGIEAAALAANREDVEVTSL